MPTPTERLERHQVSLSLAALAVGAALGLGLPAVAPFAEAAVTPVLVLLLYATFLGVPFARLGRSLRDVRFLATLLAVNFVVSPLVVLVVSRLVSHDEGLLIGVLFVLLTPCIDYVIAFTGMAGGARDRLLAASPLLMVGQLLLLPVYVSLFAGAEFARTIDLAPFVDAFVVFIVVPLAAAALTQFAASRSRAGRTVQRAVSGAMVPLMMATLATVVASQISGVAAELPTLLLAIAVFVLFALIMVPLGAAAGRVARLDVPGTRAVVFSGVTRNSLVVLPLVLTLPERYGIAPLVVVTQTLVELVLMVVLVRIVPLVVPPRQHDQRHGHGL